MDKKLNILMCLVVILILFQVVSFFLQTINIRSRQASAYSQFGTGFILGQQKDCFDISLNGAQVMSCLGIPTSKPSQYQFNPSIPAN